jgi:hypothetical protein
MVKNNKILSIALLSALLSGCITTGISVGPIFIPVDTGIGKSKEVNKPADPPPPPKAGDTLPPKPKPKPKSTEQGQDEGQSSESEVEPNGLSLNKF